MELINKMKKTEILEKLDFLFGKEKARVIYPRLVRLMDDFNTNQKGEAKNKVWLDEKDVFLITYGDTIKEPGKPALQSLHEFLKDNLKDHIEYVHILPFYPYSSDDGFSVIDYFKVNKDLGDWNDVEGMSEDFRLMFDAVINHISAESDWFQEYLKANPKYKNYFIEAEDVPELAKVFRPRALPLLSKFHTASGDKLLWTTFSTDQIDLNYKDEDLFLNIVELLLFYVSKGAKAIRLDAIGFMWKEIGTSCMHLPQTHIAIQLFRDIFEKVAPETLIITETNVPHKENISYFGDGTNEAQLVYQFPLPPLVLYSFVSGSAEYLSKWADSLELVSDKTTFFNFLASHDGIGVVPTKGILNEDELSRMVEHVKANGGNVSYKRTADGSEIPYELNINYFDAVSDKNVSMDTNIDRFIASQAILLSVVGVPAVYIHSLLGSRNYYDGVKETSRFRSINREKLDKRTLEEELSKTNSLRNTIFNRYKNLIKIRRGQKAFHPNASQKVIFANSSVFSLLRKTDDGQNAILALINVSEQKQILTINAEEYELGKGPFVDLLSNTKFLVANGKFSIQLNPFQVAWLLVVGC